MNPSAPGWIDKFGSLTLGKSNPYSEARALDADLRSCGFMYGINVGIPPYVQTAYPLSQDENAKVNLMVGLYYSYCLAHPQKDFGDFLNSVRSFYKTLELGQPNLLQKIFRSGKRSSQFEKLLDSRVYLGEPLLSRTFNSTITNVLLPIDVLSFRAFINGEEDLKSYARQLESMVINLIYRSLDTRAPIDNRKKLREVFESSRSYLDAQQPCDPEDFHSLLQDYRGTGVAKYFMDIAALTVLEGNSLETGQGSYVLKQGKLLGLKKREVEGALRDVQTFFLLHSDQMYFLRDALPGAQYYESMARFVDKLISRNSKRLRKELMESKDLMILLSKSTLRELTAEEKKRMQKQLVDVIKSIPSLAIFLLPGGAVLLPIFVKLIPKLLPSSFDENRVEKD